MCYNVKIDYLNPVTLLPFAKNADQEIYFFVNTNLAVYKKLKNVVIVEVPRGFCLTKIEPLLQSPIFRVDIRANPEVSFKFSEESEPLLKKFENKIHLWAKYVDGLMTLDFAQKTSESLIALLPIAVFKSSDIYNVKAKNVSRGSNIQINRLNVVILLGNSIPTQPAKASISFPLVHAGMSVKYSFPMFAKRYGDRKDLLTIFHTTFDNIHDLTLVVSGFLNEKRVWKFLPPNIRNLHLVGFIPKESLNFHQAAERIENHTINIGGVSLSEKVTDSPFNLFIALHIVDGDGVPIPCNIDYYCINYDSNTYHTWENYPDKQSCYFNIDVPDMSLKNFEMVIHQKSHYRFFWKGLKCDTKPFKTIFLNELHSQ
ncbi:unnamed protein product [Ambrosiozyma monospora]|uniref:Unnamed protein product n=1 Tax=Ambrosiozyma monospora TaxID=43982 RepID=A0ACB5SXT1_AMBMO|nr:unnamed protein product [Ambrosiozyma monospora]